MAVSEHYLGERGAEYVETAFFASTARTAMIRSKYNEFVKPTDSVIDFGAGVGDGLAGVNAAKRIGIEPNPHGRQACLDKGLDAVESPENLPNGSADVVLTHHCLEHVPSPLGSLTELRELVKPGGRLVVWVPMEPWRRYTKVIPQDHDNHLYAFNAKTLGNLLQEAGFSADSIVVELSSAALPGRFAERLHRSMPAPAFDALCKVWGVATGRRELRAVAVKS